MTKYIPAPRIDAKKLWEMNADDFNSWRKIYDYPRIISFFKEKLPFFKEWMSNQLVSDDMLIEYSPSKLIQEVDKVYIYNLYRQNVIKNVISEKKYEIGELFHHNFIVQDKTEIIPYMTWYYSINNNSILPLRNRTGSGRNVYFMHELELLDLGNICLDDTVNSNFKINDGINNRCLNLDFVNLNNLSIKYFNNGHQFRLWFSTVENFSIEGGFHFLDAYQSTFYCVSNPKKTNLKLLNGSFQRWKIKDCELDLDAVNSNIERWDFQGIDLFFTMSNSDISDCNFLISKIKYKHYYRRAKELQATLKRLYSQTGKRNEASKHFYLEKKYERKSYFYPKDNYKDEYYDVNKSKFYKNLFFYFKYFLIYLKSGFLNILWGYGEKPARIFVISLFFVLMFALGYNFYPYSVAETKYNLANSFYYSAVTFIGYGGDIKQTDSFLKVISAIESLLGISLLGILIAGFANNTKDY